MGYCGFYEPEHHGKIYPNDIRRTKPAIGGSSNGCGKEFSNTLHESWLQICMNEAKLISARLL